MAGVVNYKQKYEELKSRFMSAVDSAWNDGFQHGAQSAQMDQAAQQQQQNDAMMQAQAGQPQPGEEQAEGAPEQAEGEAEGQPTSQNPNEDQLGQHIEKLESMIGKSEISPMELSDLKKTLNDIRSLQVQINLTKSMNSIKSTKLAKSQSFTPKTKANLPEPAKKALTLQQEILDNVFKKWDTESSHAASGIASLLNIEGLSKKE